MLEVTKWMALINNSPNIYRISWLFAGLNTWYPIKIANQTMKFRNIWKNLCSKWEWSSSKWILVFTAKISRLLSLISCYNLYLYLKLRHLLLLFTLEITQLRFRMSLFHLLILKNMYSSILIRIRSKRLILIIN